MKPSELLIVAMVYVTSVTLCYLVLSSLQPQNMEFSLFLGAFLGSQIGAVIYHRRESAIAPFSVKASVGLLMAFLCVIQGLLFQALWGWLRYPEISISIGAVASFITPFLFYGTMQKAMMKVKAKQSK